MQTESGIWMLKQSVINYKTLLQTDGPSPGRREHSNALKVEARRLKLPPLVLNIPQTRAFFCLN